MATSLLSEYITMGKGKEALYVGEKDPLLGFRRKLNPGLHNDLLELRIFVWEATVTAPHGRAWQSLFMRAAKDSCTQLTTTAPTTGAP